MTTSTHTTIMNTFKVRSMTENTNLTKLTDSNFAAEALQSDLPVLIDFWAEWCGPCQALGPIFAEVADQFKDKVKFAKLNVDENPETPPKYAIRGIPALLMIKNGEVAATKVGSLSKKDLIEFVDNQL